MDVRVDGPVARGVLSLSTWHLARVGEGGVSRPPAQDPGARMLVPGELDFGGGVGVE